MGHLEKLSWPLKMLYQLAGYEEVCRLQPKAGNGILVADIGYISFQAELLHRTINAITLDVDPYKLGCNVLQVIVKPEIPSNRF